AVSRAWRFPSIMGNALCPAGLRALWAKQTNGVPGAGYQLPHAAGLSTPVSETTGPSRGAGARGRFALSRMDRIDERSGRQVRADGGGVMTRWLYLARFFLVVPPMPLLMVGALLVATGVSAAVMVVE